MVTRVTTMLQRVKLITPEILIDIYQIIDLANSTENLFQPKKYLVQPTKILFTQPNSSLKIT